jgi:hypothetical protein
MAGFTKDLVLLFQYLLPGFVAAWIFYAFTSFPKPSQFERVVQALIFTIFVQATVHITKTLLSMAGSKYPIFPCWDDRSYLIWSIIYALFLGLVFSYYSNNDKIHKLLRDWGITRETSYPSEWFGAFLNNITYIVLHLDGERRLYGWPKEWPSEPTKGHFVLIQPSWLVDNNEIPITGVSSIMVDVKHVKMVEFMEKTWETKNG